jgi:hypothetical protein
MVQTGATTKSSVDWENIPDDILPDTDNTYDIGSATKRWAYLYAVIAVLTSLTIGNIYLGATSEGLLLINASTEINGTLNISDNLDVQNITAHDITATGTVAITENLSADNITTEDISATGDGTFAGDLSANYVDVNVIEVEVFNVTNVSYITSGKKICLDGVTCSKYIYYNGENVTIQG